MKRKKTSLRRYMIIGFITVVKIIIMGVFSSDYQDKMFIPFVESFLSGNNPYEYYCSENLLPSFSYFPIMLLIESVGGIFLRILSPESVFIKNILFKLPLLFFDLLGFYIIEKFNVRYKPAAFIYFCSPIILYGTYMHGQLDIISTILLLAAIYHLLNWKKTRNLLWYSLLLGLALGTKFLIIAVVPILFFYVAKKKNYLVAVKYHLLAFLIVVIFTIFFWGEGFIQTAIFNKEQSAILTVGLNYGSTQVIIPILVLMIVYLNVYELNYFNKNLLISMCALLFAVFLIFTAPMPAWLTWIVPFLAIYYSYIEEDKYQGIVVYMLFNCAYIVYFIFFNQTKYADLYYLGNSLQFLKVSNDVYQYMIYTIMIACLAVLIYKIYKFGIASNGLYQRRNIPFCIGIAGDSGSGKSKMIEKIEHLFGNSKDILFIEGDGDHRWARDDEHWEQYTALDPKANYLYRQAADIHRLRSGDLVRRVDYDHELGLFSEPQKIFPKKYIVICGLHSLYLPQLRKELDLKIYMNTEEKLRKFWKIQRDIGKRGYTKESIMDQIEKRRIDAEKYIYPQKNYADIVITYFDKTLTNCYDEMHIVKLSVKIDFSIDVDVDDFVDEFMRHGVSVEHIFDEDLLHQSLIFDSEQMNDHIVDYADIAEKCIPQYEDFFTYSTEWRNQDVEGIIQLILLYMISVKMRVK